MEIEGLIELTLDHISVLLLLSSNEIVKQQQLSIINKKTDWDVFRSIFEETLTQVD